MFKDIINKATLILFAFLLLLPISLLSQEEFRVITKNLDTIYGNQHYDGKKIVTVTDAKGKTETFKTNKILSIRKEIKGWKYFEWGQKEFSDYLEINIDSMSRKELFLKAKEWIEISFLPTEYDFLIQPDSIFAEHEGRGLYKNPNYRKGYLSVWDKLPSLIPELEYKFNVDEDNYKITLVGCNRTILNGMLWPYHLDTFYTINLSFYDGGYKIDPVELIYCFVDPKIDDSPTISLNPVKVAIEGFVDGMIGNYDKAYIVNVPLSDITQCKDKSGMLSRNLRCIFNRFEVLFNDLNRTLFNYIQGNQLEPKIYVYYPEVSCYFMWRTW